MHGLRITTVALACCLLGACSSSRPTVPTSAIAASGAAAEQQLDFYDRLDQLQLVGYDDALHAILLLTQGEGAESYNARVNAARRLGLLDSGFTHGPATAITLGETAVLLDRARTGRVDKNPQTAIASLQNDGMLPADPIDPDHGITGSQFIALLSWSEMTLVMDMPAERSAPVASVPTGTADPFAGFETEDESVTGAPAPFDLVDSDPIEPTPDPIEIVAAPEPVAPGATSVEPLPDLPPAGVGSAGAATPIVAAEPARAPSPIPPNSRINWVVGQRDGP